MTFTFCFMIIYYFVDFIIVKPTILSEIVKHRTSPIPSVLKYLNQGLN